MAKHQQVSEPTFIPSWVPPSVVDVIHHLLILLPNEEDPVAAREMLARLASSPSMKPAWEEIFKKKRLRERPYLHPAKTADARHREAAKIKRRGGEDATYEASMLKLKARILGELSTIPGNENWDDQNVAARVLFYWAWKGRVEFKPIYEPHVSERDAHIKNCQAALRHVSKTLSDLALPDHANQVDEIAMELGNYADEETGIWADAVTLARSSKDAEVRAYVRGLSFFVYALFGSFLYGTVANLANAALARDDLDSACIRGFLQTDFPNPVTFLG
jgi:hypothetical protein